MYCTHHYTSLDWDKNTISCCTVGRAHSPPFTTAEDNTPCCCVICNRSFCKCRRSPAAAISNSLEFNNLTIGHLQPSHLTVTACSTPTEAGFKCANKLRQIQFNQDNAYKDQRTKGLELPWYHNLGAFHWSLVMVIGHGHGYWLCSIKLFSDLIFQ